MVRLHFTEIDLNPLFPLLVALIIIPPTPSGFDIVPRGTQSRTQAFYMRVHSPWVAEIIPPPYIVQNLIPGENAIPVIQKIAKQKTFFGGKGCLFSVFKEGVRF
jgi:hypothetical protein